MKHNSIRNPHHSFAPCEWALTHEGKFSHETTRRVLAEAERKIDSSGERFGIKQKVLHVMTEALQNIARHGGAADQIKPVYQSSFAVVRKGNGYQIISANPVNKSRVRKLARSLESVNALDPSGLKEKYRETIRRKVASPVGAAGLGLIDMARRSRQKLTFGFPRLSNDFSLFCLRITIAGRNYKCTKNKPLQHGNF